MIKDLIVKNRSYRKFDESVEINEEVLKEFVDLVRFSPSGMNLQPLKFALVSDRERADMVFPNLRWAAYLKDWNGPEKGERPTAYIIMLRDKNLFNSPVMQIDIGIACQSILLGAVEKGCGGCIIGSLNKDAIKDALNIPDDCEIQLVIALGRPTQKIVIDELEKGGDIKYWEDEIGNHHVPKRKLEDIIL
jgi:nitroreductase